MFYQMIKRKRDLWLDNPDCPVLATIQSMVSVAQTGKGLRDIQIDAIKTYIFLKIGCGNKPLAELFTSGALTSLELDNIMLTDKARSYLASHPASLALLEFALQKEDDAKDVLAPTLAKLLSSEPDKIDAEKVFSQIFYNVKYSDYLFSLPMGAGKTYLMAAFIYLDLMYAQQEPENPAFAHNFLILAPSGTKSSIVPSLKTIENFNPAWVVPEPLATNLKRIVKFEILDADSTAAKSNQIKNPNVQKIARFQPYDKMFGVVLVTNAEKVILDKVALDESGMLLPPSEEEKKDYANELRATIAKIPSLAILIDEAHHTASQNNKDEEVKLRAVVNNWAEGGCGVNSVLGFSGTPYLDKTATVDICENISFKSEEIANTVYYYPLVRGVADFLKKPVVTIVKGETSLEIVRRGVKEFFHIYGNTMYKNGCLAKMAIYCGNVARLEEEIYPEVAKIVKTLGMDPAEAILKYHRGSNVSGQKYAEPEGAQFEFEKLDFAFSKKRIVLLVQIGKEGWDCRSLTGVVLSQEGDCPKNMVLQTSCRCLRSVIDATVETACIYLNAANGKLLEEQLKQQQHTTLEAFQNGQREGTTIKRYDRTKKLDLPPLPFYQLYIEYGDKIIESDIPVNKRLNDFKRNLKDYKKEEYVTVGDFEELKKQISTKHGEYSDIGFATTYLAWIRLISKESFDLLTVDDLMTEDKTLRNIFKVISVKDSDGDSVLSPEYRQAEIRSAIRRAFWPSRKIEIKERDDLTNARLLDVEYLATHETVVVDDDTPFVPKQITCQKIVDADNGSKSTTNNADVQKWQRLLNEAIADKDDELITIYKKRLDDAKANVRYDYEKTYHYLPYRTDSTFERDFFAKALVTEDLRKKDLEIYYNGDSPFTEFVIQCYKKVDGQLESVGRYTPDFLILKRDISHKKIEKCLIVETKGKGFANDPEFIPRREYMERMFKARQNTKSDCPKYEYLYLEEDGKWYSQLVEVIGRFF